MKPLEIIVFLLGGIIAGLLVMLLFVYAQLPVTPEPACNKTQETTKETSVIVLPNGTGGTYVMPYTNTKHKYICEDGSTIWRE